MNDWWPGDDVEADTCVRCGAAPGKPCTAACDCEDCDDDRERGPVERRREAA